MDYVRTTRTRASASERSCLSPPLGTLFTVIVNDKGEPFLLASKTDSKADVLTGHEWFSFPTTCWSLKGKRRCCALVRGQRLHALLIPGEPAATISAVPFQVRQPHQQSTGGFITHRTRRHKELHFRSVPARKVR